MTENLQNTEDTNTLREKEILEKKDDLMQSISAMVRRDLLFISATSGLLSSFLTYQFIRGKIGVIIPSLMFTGVMVITIIGLQYVQIKLFKDELEQFIKNINRK